ncbi:Interferon alpha-inducible 6 27 protein [Rutstroemia sp. NJR-2017a BBW]|nr:Interferon alpha-inducible 6 27 protein [Rutstroemia sp. NJR-2017a BBW]
MDRTCIRNWDLILHLDGSVENIAQNPLTFSEPAKLYPVRYRLPEAISDRIIISQDRIQRVELFALGSILYEIIAYHQLFHEIYEGVDNEEKIQSLIAKGEFPDDLWGLSITPTILGYWCPKFQEEIFNLYKHNYIKNHPIRFGFQALDGFISATSLVTVPILGAIGFSAVGPVAGSAAAA